MTEFITRNHGNKDFEIIVKTDSKEHYKATQDFARRLIDHAKPMTNGDRIRAMTDEELALFLAEKYANASVLRLQDVGHEPTATEIKVLTNTLRKTWMRWLKQPAEVDHG